MQKYFVLILFSLLSFWSCKTKYNLPSFAADTRKVSAPDYSKSENWAALPTKKDYADTLPITYKTDTLPANYLKDRQAEAEVDVFYIHPTVNEDRTHWNADYHNDSLNHLVDLKPIMHQASIFNGTGKIYAPRYRQMTLGGFGTKDTASKRQALNLAYQDVKAAFEYYLKNYNQGRPFFIVSHSQGTVHGLRLVRELIDGKPLQDQLVAAYLVGFAFKPDTLKYIRVCNSPEQTGCVMHWASYRKHSRIPFPNWYKGAVCVNPVNWTTDGTPASADLHKGMVWSNYSKKEKHLDVREHKGALWVKSPFPIAPVNNFHVGDYNLFWFNIRENAELRAKTFLEKKK
jgi:hypothetical protein